MDCIIPGPSVKSFCAALACLSRVGKDLLVEFDAVEGLTLRALSDSKAVFGSFHYEPAFFTVCRAGATFLSANSRKSKKKRSRQEDPEEDRFCVRLSIKSLAAVVRPRKDVRHLHLRSTPDFLLEFEFQLLPGPRRVIHKVGFAQAPSIAAVARMEQASEMVVHPRILHTLLEPLRRSAEMALLIQESHRLISGVSFAHDDFATASSSMENTTQTNNNASLKTETSLSYDELVDLSYVSTVSGDDEQPPADLKEQVVLVFTLKEFKALLQFALLLEEQPLSIQFYWGGRPMVVTTQQPGLMKAELVMATLDHQLLAPSMKATN